MRKIFSLVLILGFQTLISQDLKVNIGNEIKGAGGYSKVVNYEDGIVLAGFHSNKSGIYIESFSKEGVSKNLYKRKKVEDGFNYEPAFNEFKGWVDGSEDPRNFYVSKDHFIKVSLGRSGNKSQLKAFLIKKSDLSLFKSITLAEASKERGWSIPFQNKYYAFTYKIDFVNKRLIVASFDDFDNQKSDMTVKVFNYELQLLNTYKGENPFLFKSTSFIDLAYSSNGVALVLKGKPAKGKDYEFSTLLFKEIPEKVKKQWNENQIIIQKVDFANEDRLLIWGKKIRKNGKVNILESEYFQEIDFTNGELMNEFIYQFSEDESKLINGEKANFEASKYIAKQIILLPNGELGFISERSYFSFEANAVFRSTYNLILTVLKSDGSLKFRKIIEKGQSTGPFMDYCSYGLLMNYESIFIIFNDSKKNYNNGVFQKEQKVVSYDVKKKKNAVVAYEKVSIKDGSSERKVLIENNEMPLGGLPSGIAFRFVINSSNTFLNSYFISGLRKTVPVIIELN